MPVAGVDVVDVPAGDVEDAVEHSDERLVHLERRLHDAGRQAHRLLEVLHLRRRAQRSADGGHHHRGGQALAHDIAQRHGDAVGVRQVPVVEVAADLPGRREVRGHLETFAVERRAGKHPLLHVGRVLHLLRALGDHRLQPPQVGLVLELEPAAADRVDDRQVELGRADGLDEVAMRAVLHRGLAQLRVVDPGDHDHGDVGLERTQLAKQPVARFVGQAHV